MPTTSEEKKRANREAVARHRKRKKLQAQKLYIPPDLWKKPTGRPMIQEMKTCKMNPTQPARKKPTEKRTDPKFSTTQKLVAHDTIWDFGQFFWQDGKKQSYLEMKRRMNTLVEQVGKEFKWLQTTDGTWQLFYVSTFGGEEVLHPWLEVKISKVTTGKERYLYGVFALRSFEANDDIGFYTGVITKPRKDNESVFLISVGDIAHIDIPYVDEKRLRFGMGMHMCNDNDWPNGYDSNELNNNNAILCDEFIIQATKDIKKGDEITICYNLSTEDD